MLRKCNAQLLAYLLLVGTRQRQVVGEGIARVGGQGKRSRLRAQLLYLRAVLLCQAVTCRRGAAQLGAKLCDALVACFLGNER